MPSYYHNLLNNFSSDHSGYCLSQEVSKITVDNGPTHDMTNLLFIA
jgi:hypothetical protein